jgi:hypothetical protein
MLFDIVEAKVVKNYILYIRFEDGLSGQIDISSIVPFEGFFSPLKELSYFATVRIDKDLGTIVWDSGADLAPDVLYEIISAQNGLN